jgi:hypothetical protein
MGERRWETGEDLTEVSFLARTFLSFTSFGTDHE